MIAAGSLLEFALSEIPSFGVGRIRSMFVYPLNFDEFMLALDQKLLLEAKRKCNPDKQLSEAVHAKLIETLKKFLILGGMPEVVKCYIRGVDLLECGRVLDDLVISMKTDFAKYRDRVPSLRINEVFSSVANQTGKKFVYANVSSESNHKQLKEALDLLILSGLVIPVVHASGNGIPLGSEINLKKRKMVLLDTGVYQRVLGLEISEVILSADIEMLNKGSLVEQYCGLEILKAGSPYLHKDLYYWHREARNSNAEVDYLIQKNGMIVPVEIKSGKKGAMKSLNLFLKEKGGKYGVCFSSGRGGMLETVQVWSLYAISEFLNSDLN